MEINICQKKGENRMKILERIVASSYYETRIHCGILEKIKYTYLAKYKNEWQPWSHARFDRKIRRRKQIERALLTLMMWSECVVCARFFDTNHCITYLPACLPAWFYIRRDKNIIEEHLSCCVVVMSFLLSIDALWKLFMYILRAKIRHNIQRDSRRFNLWLEPFEGTSRQLK